MLVVNPTAAATRRTTCHFFVSLQRAANNCPRRQLLLRVWLLPRPRQPGMRFKLL